MVDQKPAYGLTHPSTGWFVPIIAALALIAIGYLVFSAEARPKPSLMSAHAIVELSQGHGSATHIGSGIYVTAAHVVGDNTAVKINGVDSEVLWANRAYDIALLSGPKNAASVRLTCRTAPVGETGLSHGNPMTFTDITTSMTVAGTAREIGRWKVALPMDGTVGPGMSGGGWISDGGALAGVNVGAALAPTTTGLPSYYGLAIVVPSSVVCDLMGRRV